MKVFCQAAMQPPGAGRNPIDPRVVSLYACIGIAFPATNSIGRIYQSIMRHKFVGFPEAVQETADKGQHKLSVRLYATIRIYSTKLNATI